MSAGQELPVLPPGWIGDNDEEPEVAQAPEDVAPEPQLMSREVDGAMEDQPQGNEEPEAEQPGAVPVDHAERVQRFLDWLRPQTAGEETEMVHDLLTCISAINKYEDSVLKVVEEKRLKELVERGKGDFFLACFRAMQTAEQIQKEKGGDNLTVDQIAALVMYTFEFRGKDVYSSMNRIIGEICNQSEKSIEAEHAAWWPFIRLFLSACKTAAIPCKAGELLYRGQPLHCEAFEEGGQWLPKRCLSTSKSLEQARNFPKQKSGELVKIVIKEQTVYGVPMSPFSNYMEEEWLLLPNQCFTVIGVHPPSAPPPRGCNHIREVEMEPSKPGEDVLREIPVSDDSVKTIELSVLAHINASCTDAETITFRQPHGLTDAVGVRYSGGSVEGLQDEKLYTVRLNSDGSSAQLFPAGNSQTPAQLPAQLPPGAHFFRTVCLKLQVSEYRTLWMRSGKGYNAFKFGGKELCLGLQWGGVRVVDTMKLPNFCLWFAQADIVFAIILVVLLARNSHGGAAYLFPFVDILVQIAFCWRLHWMIRKTGIMSAADILKQRYPFYILRFLCGVATLLTFLAVETASENALAFLMILSLKVFSPFSMAVTLAYCYRSGAVHSVDGQAAAALSLDNFINGPRMEILAFKCSGSLFVYYESCLHGYVAQLLHVSGAFFIFAGFCIGAAIDWVRCCNMCSKMLDKDERDTPEVCHGPPMMLLFPATAMSYLVRLVTYFAHSMVSMRIEEWVHAGGEEECMVALGRWQRQNCEAALERLYWKRVREELAAKRREEKAQATAQDSAQPIEAEP